MLRTAKHVRKTRVAEHLAATHGVRFGRAVGVEQQRVPRLEGVRLALWIRRTLDDAEDGTAGSKLLDLTRLRA